MHFGLSEGMKIKILLLPQGEDPDSFAQSHTSEEVERYIEENETDFIRFKTRILLDDAGDDPVARSRVISDIARSISVIPDEILRTAYVTDCSRLLAFDEKVLALQVAKLRAESAHKEAEEAARDRARQSLGNVADTPAAASPEQPATAVAPQQPATAPRQPEAQSARATELRGVERELARYIVRYAMVPAFLAEIDDQGNTAPMTVAEYVDAELRFDDIHFANSDIRRLFEETMTLLPDYRAARTEAERRADENRARARVEGIEAIRNEHAAEGIAAIERAEAALDEQLDAARAAELDTFDQQWAEKILISSPDDAVRSLATDLAADRHHLSKIHTKYAHVETERERIPILVPRAVYELKYALLEMELRDTTRSIAAAAGDFDRQQQLMQRIVELSEVRKELARYLGPSLGLTSFNP